MISSFSSFAFAEVTRTSAAEASKAAHAEASAALNEYRAVFANYESNFEADRDAFTQQHPDMSLDEVEEMKENKEAELSAAPEISPEVVRQIHERDARVSIGYSCLVLPSHSFCCPFCRSKPSESPWRRRTRPTARLKQRFATSR